MKRTMKTNRLFLSMLAVGLLLTSCVNVNFEKVAASDTRVEKEYKMDAFTKLHVSTVAHVKYVQSTEGDYRVVMSCPDNYVDLFEFKVDGDMLNVKFTKTATNIESGKVDILVYSPTMSEITNAGVCTVVVDSLKGSTLKVENAGVGALKLKGLDVERMAVRCSGAGGIDLDGTAPVLSLECSGVGSINAANLKARRVKGSVSGVGGIECYASDSLKASVSGVGSLKYAGNPQVKNLHRTGVGQIAEM